VFFVKKVSKSILWNEAYQFFCFKLIKQSFRLIIKHNLFSCIVIEAFQKHYK